MSLLEAAELLLRRGYVRLGFEASRRLWTSIVKLAAMSGGSVVVDSSEARVVDKAALASLALELGLTLDVVAKHVSWRDFEAYAARVMEEQGYKVERNVRLPGLEADVVGVRYHYMVAVECKQWSRCSPSRLRPAAKRHTWKLKPLLEYTGAKLGVGVIVVARTPRVKVLEGCLVIPIHGLGEVLEDPVGWAEELGALVIRKEQE